MSELDFYLAAATRFSSGEVIQSAARPINLTADVPANPDVHTQTKFVGASFHSAYTDAAKFVFQAEQWTAKHRATPFERSGTVLDFGAGWGRITRMLLTRIPSSQIYCLDVDQSMTVLIQATLPGVNTLTTAALPPCMLRDSSIDVAFAFSVFSHLSEDSHRAWATEFGRIIQPGGLVHMTVLDQLFLDQIAACQASVLAGDKAGFAVMLASLLPNLDKARLAYARNEFIYAAPQGDDGPRAKESYGWAIAPRMWLESEWSKSGFELVEWIPSGILFNQAMVCLRKIR